MPYLPRPVDPKLKPQVCWDSGSGRSGVIFEWNDGKAASNLRKHGVSFFEAVEVFSDELASTVPDPDHSANEFRYLTFGVTPSSRYIVVAYTETSDSIRIISARLMTPRERRAYEA